MPRTFQATVALIVTLIAIGLLTLVNVLQTNSSEKKVIELSQRVDKLTKATQKIQDKLAKGVAVNNSGNSNVGSSRQPPAQNDNYAKFLNDPNNILKGPTKPFIPSGAIEGGTLQKLMTSDPKGFNWLLENSVDVANIQSLMHNTLAARDWEEPDKFTPELAYKIEVSPDYKVYTIHLRKGVYWQTPKHPKLDQEKYKWMAKKHELKAEDVKFLVDLIKNPQVEAGSARNYYQDLDKVEIVDDYTLKIFWKKKTYVSMNATLTLYPMPKWLFTKEEDGTPIPDATLGLKFNNHWASAYPIGTGAYKFDKFEKSVAFHLERNEDYWGKKPPITRIEAKIIKDPQQGLLKLKSGEIDYGVLRPAQYNTEILKGKNTPFTRGDIKYKVVDRFAYYYLGWNADKPMFKDKMVRRALTHAFDRQGIVKNVFFNLGTIQTGPYYYKHNANDPGVKPFGYDLNKAKELLAKAGWKDTDGNGILDKVINGEKKEFKFTILAYGHSSEWKSALAVYKEALRKIGISMNFSPVDWPTMQKKMDEKKFDAFTGGWGLSWAIDPYQLWHSSEANKAKGSNRVGFRNKRADEIIVTLRETFDPQKRTELLREFHRLLHEEQPYTFFFAPKSVLAWWPHLENVQVQKIRPQFHSIPWYIDPSKSKKNK